MRTATTLELTEDERRVLLRALTYWLANHEVMVRHDYNNHLTLAHDVEVARELEMRATMGSLHE